MMRRLHRFLHRLATVATCYAALTVAVRLPAATCTDTACVSVTGRLASIDSTRSLLLNALLGQMLGTTVSLSAVEWQRIADSQINLLDLLNVMRVKMGVGTTTEALNTDIDLLQFLQASAEALQAEGNTLTANAITSLSANVNPGTIRLGELLNLCASCTSYADINLSVLDLVNGSASLFNYHHMFNTPTPITISGSSLGLGTVANIQLYAQILQPPEIICSTGGTSFYGAAIRVKLDVNLLNVNLTSALATQLASLGITLPTSSSNLQISLSHLGLYVDVARAQGTLQSVDAITQVVTLQNVRPGIVNLYLGLIDDSIFFTRTPIGTNDLQYGTIGSLNVTIAVPITGPTVAITAAVKARARAIGSSPFNSTLTYTGPYPQQQTVNTSGTFLTNLTSTLLNNLDLSIEVTNPQPLATAVQLLFDVLITLIKGALTTVYRLALQGPLNLVLTVVLNPALGLLGIRLGEADITVLGARRRCRYSLSGFVYLDGNRNGFKDDPEAGTTLTLSAKLILESAPTVALQAVTVNPTTGAYVFTNIESGNYRIIIDDNATTTDITPATLPAGWVVTEQAGLIRSNVAVSSDLPNLNFGLASGALAGGRVFRDNGISGGTANDGQRNGGELGLAGVTVQLRNASNVVIATATSGDDGTFSLFIPGTVAIGSVLSIVETNPNATISTGASVGTTAGTYDRNTDTLTFTHTNAAGYSGIAFGDVTTAQFTGDNEKASSAGSTVTYVHQFIAGSAGSVAFTVAHTSTPAIDGWTETIYLDANANGQIDAGEQPVPSSVSVSNGETVSLVLKVAIPAAAPQNARNTSTITATFTYTNATPALIQTLAHTDLTTVSSGTTAGLSIVKAVDKAAARPGDTIVYTITFTNDSASPLRNVVVMDQVPTYTTAVSVGNGTVPASLGTVTVTSPAVGATGAIRWSFSGELAPGAAGSVTFSVKLDQ